MDRHATATAPRAGSAPARRDPERTRREILTAAIDEFSRNGLLGGRVDAIAERTRTTKRMIYYYFESKERLYEAALLETYREMRETEGQLHLESLEPSAALRLLARTSIEHHERHLAFVRLVVFENTLSEGAIHLMDDAARQMNQSAVGILEDILERGRASGVFRAGPGAPSALDVHQVISSLAFFRTSNRATFRELFGRDMLAAGEEGVRMRAQLEDTVMRYVLADPDAEPVAPTA